nr:MAG TPA: hypothetical protein [Caudoviricetes sp.]
MFSSNGLHLGVFFIILVSKGEILNTLEVILWY